MVILAISLIKLWVQNRVFTHRTSICLYFPNLKKKKKKKNLSQTLNFTNTPIFQEKKQKK